MPQKAEQLHSMVQSSAAVKVHYLLTVVIAIENMMLWVIIQKIIWILTD